MKTIAVLLLLVLSGCYNTIEKRFIYPQYSFTPDINSPYDIEISVRGDALYHMDEISIFLHKTHSFILSKKPELSVMDLSVIIYPYDEEGEEPGLYWWFTGYDDKGKKVFQLKSFKGMYHRDTKIIQVLWREKTGLAEYAHEVLHRLGYQHPDSGENIGIWATEELMTLQKEATEEGMKELIKYREWKEEN